MIASARWLPPALLMVAALLGPAVSGPIEPPVRAQTAAQLLAPGTRVREARLPVGFVRGTELRREGAGVGIRTPSGWQTIEGASDAPLRERVLWLGSDHQGRDLLARAAWGARTSLTVAIWACVTALILGTAAGVAGAWGPAALRGPLRLTYDCVIALPRIVLLLLLGSMLGRSPTMLGLAVGLTAWTGLARLVEAESRSLIRRPFFAASRTGGVGKWRQAIRHLLPNLTPLLRVAVPLIATEAILLEATLAFVGLNSDSPSWGTMISDARRWLPGAWWMLVCPGILIVFSALAFHGLSRADSSLGTAPSTGARIFGPPRRAGGTGRSGTPPRGVGRA